MTPPNTATPATTTDDDSNEGVEFGPVLYGDPDEYHFLHALIQLASWQPPGYEEED